MLVEEVVIILMVVVVVLVAFVEQHQIAGIKDPLRSVLWSV